MYSPGLDEQFDHFQIAHSGSDGERRLAHCIDGVDLRAKTKWRLADDAAGSRLLSLDHLALLVGVVDVVDDRLLIMLVNRDVESDFGRRRSFHVPRRVILQRVNWRMVAVEAREVGEVDVLWYVRVRHGHGRQ